MRNVDGSQRIIHRDKPKQGYRCNKEKFFSVAQHRRLQQPRLAQRRSPNDPRYGLVARRLTPRQALGQWPSMRGFAYKQGPI